MGQQELFGGAKANDWLLSVQGRNKKRKWKLEKEDIFVKRPCGEVNGECCQGEARGQRRAEVNGNELKTSQSTRKQKTQRMLTDLILEECNSKRISTLIVESEESSSVDGYPRYSQVQDKNSSNPSGGAAFSCFEDDSSLQPMYTTICI
ncbi:hypothetical protein NM208_g12540 [Fusarium decemcellulare]|uniref:Uncharacterized protein n=1 Tax=Fusarium decemcellulare TaxID=57161 RepID=A0ACC1RN80_9HYPO|nr:hypothetical protein NM208_g12540 [Fusarium decemcellulare]